MYRKIIRGANIDFLILGRSEAKTITPEVPYAIISIRDVNLGDAHLAPSDLCKGVLRLAFQDKEVAEDNERVFLPKDARRIIKFLEPLIYEIECIVVNCEAGLCRSAGVAAALSYIVNGEDTAIYKYYRPNSLVRRTIIEEHQKLQEDKQDG